MFGWVLRWVGVWMGVEVGGCRGWFVKSISVVYWGESWA